MKPLTDTQRAALARLRQGPFFAKRTHWRRGTMRINGATVAILERAGLIERRPVETARHVTDMIVLTTDGPEEAAKAAALQRARAAAVGGTTR